jgi:hypothetical protein
MKLVASKKVMMSQISGESVLLDTQRGIYFGLNAVGTHVWMQLQNGASLDDLVRSTVTCFEVTEQQCRSDIVRLLDDLLSQGLIENQLPTSGDQVVEP